MRPTMMDVAQAAGVSLKTVSRVVNREQGVRTTTLRSVQEAIQELGYSRNEHARVLRQNRASRMLGLVTRDVSNPFYSAIARGVEEEVRDRALLVIAGSSDEDAERERALLEVLCERRVGGLIVAPTGSDHSFLAPELALGTPITFIDRPPWRLAADSILLDNVGGARDAVEHLLARCTPSGCGRAGRSRGRPARGLHDIRARTGVPNGSSRRRFARRRSARATRLPRHQER